MIGGTPIFVLKAGTERESGKRAQSKNIAASKAIADAVRTTLGPKGMDKMLVDSMGDVIIKNLATRNILFSKHIRTADNPDPVWNYLQI